MSIVVLSPQKCGRIDINMLKRTAEIASSRKPILVIFNQMGRYQDWVKSTADAARICEEHRKIIHERAIHDHGACGSIKVFLTEFTDYAAQHDNMQRRGIKSTEEVATIVFKCA